MNVVLISTYDLGHQPFGLASPAAWLRELGHSVSCVDLAVSTMPSLVIREAQAVAFFLPMHTATRLALDAIRKVRILNPSSRLIAYGLYAPMNADLLREAGIDSILGGEFEADLVAALNAPRDDVSMDRLAFRVPDRSSLPVLQRYSKLRIDGGAKLVGYTEASRGCKHLCRHCPVVPVYNGTFRVVAADVVMEDIRRQIAAGAQHITFGDPDFFNGPTHAMRLVRALHGEFPAITYDATIKIEHLLGQRHYLPELRDTGCLFVTTAVESVDDAVLSRLEKGHTRADFIEVVSLFRKHGLSLAPTFIPFTPWTTIEGYHDLLGTIRGLSLIENVAPVQLALRLLIPQGSRMLELSDMQACLERFDKTALLYRWRHVDPSVDRLASRLLSLVSECQKNGMPRAAVFDAICNEANLERLPENYNLLPRAAIPYMDEPWYC
jgi:radical SAM superfamily enzyme YgiQ (UPF0313 family)